MENSNEYSRAGQPWEMNEDSQLVKNYNINNLDIMTISKIHKRMPGGIISRLKHHNIINIRTSARGYLDYKNSDLYKEICKNKQEQKKEQKGKKIQDISIKNNDESHIIQIKKDVKEINEIQTEIASLKKDVKEMLRLMNALYEFETEQRIESA